MISLQSLAQTESDASDPPADELAETTAADDGRADALPLDQAFELLQNERRRRVLHAVQEAEGETTLGDVSERIAARENDKPRAQLDSQERKRVYVGLYQCHLPRMDDADVVEFDEDGSTIEAGPHADELAQYLETATEEDGGTTWPQAAGLAGATGLLLGGLATYAVPQALPAVVVLALLGAGLAYVVDVEEQFADD